MNQEILYKYISGEATQIEKEEVACWLDADEKNRKEFLAQRKLYDISIWQQEAAFVTGDQSVSNKKRWTWRKVMIEVSKTAAIFILAFSVLYTFLINEKQTEPTAMQTIFVPPGQRAELTLTDGTKVWLNAKTTFTFPNHFSSGNRHVILDGEGYFEVSKDAQRPFVVETEKHDIQVLGTEFNVISYAGSSLFETSLLKGEVEVSSRSDKQTVRLEPNTRTYLQNGLLRKVPIEHTNYFLWKSGLICFHDEPVKRMIEKLELYYDVTINVENKELLEKHYTGKFRTKDGVEHVLKVLQLRSKFSYTKDDDLNLITIK